MRKLEPGTVLLGKYRIDGVIGRGGMGLVLKAWHLGLEEPVAIKVLRDDVALADETIARFIREAQAAVKLKSEHVARIIDVGAFADGKPYMVMELLEGQDLGQLLAERGQLQPSFAIDLVIQACEALAEAHSLGIVHRDIKPTNLFLTSHPDGSMLLKVLDFGISKSPGGADLSLTQTWSMLGSPAYMSPEQMRSARHVDARSDVWSLGAVLYEVIEGHLPFPAESFSEMCVMVAVDAPAPMRSTPPALAAIAMRCLAKQPEERFANVAELARSLAQLAREPSKAQILVERMTRMLGRGTVRRTPAVGVPQTRPSAPAMSLAPPAMSLAPPAMSLAPPAMSLAPPAMSLAPPAMPAPATRPSSSPMPMVYAAPGMSSHAMPRVHATPVMASPAMAPSMAPAVSLPAMSPVMSPPASASPAMLPPAMAASGIHAPPMHAPAAYASTTFGAAISAPVMSAGAMTDAMAAPNVRAPSTRAPTDPALLSTHVVRRRPRQASWATVAAAFVALATATAIIVATARNSRHDSARAPSPQAPEVVHMAPIAAEPSAPGADAHPAGNPPSITTP